MVKDHAIPVNIRAELGQVLLQMSDDFLDTVNDVLRPFHASESKLSLLLLLNQASLQNKSLQPSEIADHLGIRRASVTKQLIGLKFHGLIKRTINVEDQRMVNVVLTEKGHYLLELVMPHYWQACAKFSHGLTDEETVTLLRLLRKIHPQKEI